MRNMVIIYQKKPYAHFLFDTKPKNIGCAFYDYKKIIIINVLVINLMANSKIIIYVKGTALPCFA